MSLTQLIRTMHNIYRVWTPTEKNSNFCENLYFFLSNFRIYFTISSVEITSLKISIRNKNDWINNFFFEIVTIIKIFLNFAKFEEKKTRNCQSLVNLSLPSILSVSQHDVAYVTLSRVMPHHTWQYFFSIFCCHMNQFA